MESLVSKRKKMESCNSTLEQTLQDGKLHRQVNSLIVAHLRDNNLSQAASAVASATMTSLNVEAPPNKLLELVAKGLAAEKDDILRGVPSNPLYDSATLVPAAYGTILAPRAAAVDFGIDKSVLCSIKLKKVFDIDKREKR
ncbi:hypothetical protein ACOSP7_026021 [Xanthoceras sorbifolium]